jgi:hypothetical protein
MSTKFINDQWRLPNNENKDKQSNYSMDFDGSSYIDIGNDISVSGDCTVSFWFKVSAIPNSSPEVIFARYTGSSDADFLIIGLYLQGVLASNNSNASGSKTTRANVTLTANSWHHCVVTKVSGVVTNIYIDGTDRAGSVGSYEWWGAGSTNSGFIGQKANSDSLFNGQIDGVSIFDYALSASQVTTLYGSSSTGIGNPMSLSPKPVAYYPLGDQDAFNGANYLVPNSSLKDYVFDFDASSSNYIDCGNDSSLSPSSFTFSLWSKSDLSNVGWFTKYSSENYGFGIYGSVIFLNIKTSAGWGGLSVSKSTYLTANTWHHIVGTYDETDLKIYIDGNLAGSLAKAGPITYSSRNTRIGALEGNSTFYLNGQLSNVSIWNTALTDGTGGTPNQIETIYNNGSPSDISSLNPVSWWKLDASDTYDSSTGNWTIEDHAGTNDGTSSGMTQANLVQSDLSFTSGYSPYALDFDGTNDYIDCGDSDDFSFGDDSNDSPFSVSAWIKVGDTGINRIVNKVDGTNAEWLFSTGTNNRTLVLNLYSSGATSSGPNRGVAGSTSLNSYVNQWVHVACSYDGRGGNDAYDGMKLYFNGQLETTTNLSAGVTYTAMANTVAPLRIGSDINFTNYYFNGSISNVSVWNSELTSSQVTELYSEGVPQNLNNHSAYSNLVSWWQLGSNSSFNTNWTVLDEKGSNNGTSANMGEDAIVDGVGSYANGVSSGMSDNIVGDAFGSSANSLSYNMDVLDRSTDVPN